jgi:membrane-associated phospholipid phosphatase
MGFMVTVPIFPLRDWLRQVPNQAAGGLRTYTGAHPVLVSGVGLLALCWGSMLTLDRPIAQLFGHHMPDPVIAAFERITDLGLAGPYVFGAIAVFLAGRALFLWTLPGASSFAFYKASRVAGFVLASLALSGLVVHAFKAGLGRLRPKHYLDDGLYGFAHGNADWATNSFPSGHAQTVFAVAAAIGLFYPRAAPYLLGFAALIGLSRIGVAAHFLSDVVFGAFVGAASAFVLWRTVYDRGALPSPSALRTVPAQQETPA